MHSTRRVRNQLAPVMHARVKSLNILRMYSVRENLLWKIEQRFARGDFSGLQWSSDSYSLSSADYDYLFHVDDNSCSSQLKMEKDFFLLLVVENKIPPGMVCHLLSMYSYRQLFLASEVIPVPAHIAEDCKRLTVINFSPQTDGKQLRKAEVSGTAKLLQQLWKKRLTYLKSHHQYWSKIEDNISREVKNDLEKKWKTEKEEAVMRQEAELRKSVFPIEAVNDPDQWHRILVATMKGILDAPTPFEASLTLSFAFETFNNSFPEKAITVWDEDCIKRERKERRVLKEGIRTTKKVIKVYKEYTRFKKAEISKMKK